MAGCAKAGRNKKTGQNARYINERRREVNKRRKMERHAKRCAPKVDPLMPRGITRSLRRVHKHEAWVLIAANKLVLGTQPD